MQIPDRVRRLLLLMGAALLTSCSPFPNRQQNTPGTMYVLEWHRHAGTVQNAASPPCGALLVSQPRSGPGFDTVRMAYVKQHYRLDYFAHHQWADTPARMLAPLLVRSLDDSGLFRTVVAESVPVNADLRLDSEVLHLQQVFSGKRSTVQLSVRVDVIDTVRHRMLFSRIFALSEAAASADPYGGAVAANRAVGRLLDELVKALRGRIDDGSLGCGTGRVSAHSPE